MADWLSRTYFGKDANLQTKMQKLVNLIPKEFKEEILQTEYHINDDSSAIPTEITPSNIPANQYIPDKQIIERFTTKLI